MDKLLIDELTRQYGETYRRLIEDALAWLDERESQWELDDRIDRVEFIAGLVSRATSLSKGAK